MYIKRNKAGEIEQLSRVATGDCQERIDVDAPELDVFLEREDSESGGKLAQSDLGLVRVIEDLVDVLIERNLISFTDFPQAARDKLMTRQSLRQQRNSVALLGERDEEDAI
ncbi:tryptophan synthase subunit beta like protein [Halomonas sp. YLGW01]|uniref:tryptophan synthase subunit beta like protein n=1 Tax=Halomonas sp. YLGW01 TaxID=2773308 RepID=UPI00177E10DA|nr:tryptophan synthase subunit beta like protein [Halomonas sp. YLGW01]